MPRSAPPAYLGLPASLVSVSSVKVALCPLSMVGVWMGNQPMMPSEKPVSPGCRTSGILDNGGGAVCFGRRIGGGGGALDGGFCSCSSAPQSHSGNKNRQSRPVQNLFTYASSNLLLCLKQGGGVL